MGHPSNLLALFLDYTAVNFMLEGKEGLLVGGGGVFLCFGFGLGKFLVFFFFLIPQNFAAFDHPVVFFSVEMF